MTTADAYEAIAENMAPYLQDEQKIILNAGGIGGSLLVYNTIKKKGYNPKITIAETDTCMYGCKVPEPNTSLIKSIKNKLMFSLLPDVEPDKFLDAINFIYPQLSYINDPLASGLWDATCLHVGGMIFNEDKIRKKEKFLFYIEGVTPEIGEYMEMLDSERMDVAKAMGLKSESVNEWLNSSYGIPIGPLSQMLHKNEPYRYNAFAPTDFNHRYLTEEVPTKMIPQLEMAKILGVPQPMTEWAISKASELVGRNLYQGSRTLEKLGLLPEDIASYSINGIKPYLERMNSNKTIKQEV
jgi:opine dehydrogenase